MASAWIRGTMKPGVAAHTTGTGFLDYANLDLDAHRRDRLKAFVAMLAQLGLARPPVVED